MTNQNPIRTLCCVTEKITFNFQVSNMPTNQQGQCIDVGGFSPVQNVGYDHFSSFSFLGERRDTAAAGLAAATL